MTHYVLVAASRNVILQSKEYFSEQCQLSRSHGPSAAIVESAFISIANDILFDAWHALEKFGGTSTIPAIHRNIDMLTTTASEYTSTKASRSIMFAACRVKAMGYIR